MQLVDRVGNSWCWWFETGKGPVAVGAAKRAPVPQNNACESAETYVTAGWRDMVRGGRGKTKERA
jgi:hypothetical protein